MESVTPPFADFALEIYAASRGYFVPPALVREALGSSSHCFSLPPGVRSRHDFFVGVMCACASLSPHGPEEPHQQGP